MPEPNAGGARSGTMFMVISALLFAWFGFGGSWVHQYTNTTPPQLLVMVVVLKLTLRGGAIAFGASAVLSMVGSVLGELLYALAGLATAVLFVIVAIWDWTNPQGYYSGVPPVLLVLFAAWNGWGSWMGLRAVLQARPPGDGREQPLGDPG